MQYSFDSQTRPETVESVIHPAIYLVRYTDKDEEADETARFVHYTFLDRVVMAGTYECQRTASKIYRQAETDTKFFPSDPQTEDPDVAVARWKQAFEHYLSEYKELPIVLVLHNQTIEAISGLQPRSGGIVGAFPTKDGCNFRILS